MKIFLMSSTVKALLLYILFTMVSTSGFSQEKNYALKATIVDSSGVPIEFGNFILLNPEDSTILKGIDFWDGAVELLGIQQERVLIKIMVNEYKIMFLSFEYTGSGDVFDLGKLILEKDVTELDGVDIIYRIPMFEREVGKLIVNVEGTILSDKGTVVDVLKAAPNVIVKSGGEVIVVGKGTAILYLDGQRVNSLDMLSAISARDIQKINIIENPSAKYDAEGNAVVEIITRKGALRGYQGTVYAQAIKRTNFLTMYGGNFSYRRDWFSAYVAGAQQIGTFHTVDNYFREINGDSLVAMDNRILTDTKHKFDAGILVKTNYRLDSINTLFLNYNGIAHNYESATDNVNEIRENNSNNGTISSISKAAPKWRMNTFTGGYNRVLDTLGSAFKLSAQFTRFDFTNSSMINQVTNFGSSQESKFNNTNFNNIDVATAQADYGKKFSEKIKMDLGVKNSYVSNRSGIELKYDDMNGNWITDSSRYNQFDYTENVSAGYGEISGKLKKFSYNVGLRYEWTKAYGNSFKSGAGIIDRRYGYLFPNVQCNYEVIPDLVVGASYVARINRPSFQDLDPFQNFIDSLSSLQGNPLLRPSITNGAELSLVYMEYASLKLSYNKSIDPIVLTVVQNPGTNSFSAIPQNIESSDMYTIGIVLPYELPWWTTFNSFGYTWNNYKYNDNDNPIVNNKPSLYVSFYNEFRIPKILNIEITYEWTSPGAQGVFIMRPYQSLGASITRKFMKEKLTARLSVFDAMYREIETGTTTLGKFYVDYNSRMDTRSLQLSLTYNFGKMKNIEFTGSGINDTERDRIKE